MTSRRPTLRFRLPEGVTLALLELCADRACASPLSSHEVVGESFKPDEDLPEGPVFWRLTRADGIGGASPTWEFFVGARSAPVDTVSGAVVDFDGNGYADLVFGHAQGNGHYGVVYALAGGPSGLEPSAELTVAVSNGLGKALGYAGDVNGDGFGDVIAATEPNGFGMGTACLFLGSSKGLDPQPAFDIIGLESSNYFAFSAVVGAGDVNGDGFGDLVLARHTGGAYVVYGAPAGLSCTTLGVCSDHPRIGGELGSAFYEHGSTAAALGDVNGDGLGDFAVGSTTSMGATDGNVGVFLGAPGGVAASPVATLSGATFGLDEFGRLLDGAGDVDGDGLADLLVASLDASDGSPGGRALVFRGDATLGVAASPLGTFDAPSPGSLGKPASLSGGANVDGDGFDDLLIGAGSGEHGPERPAVHYGGATGFAAAPEILDVAGYGNLGLGAGLLGDTDGDGRPELALTGDDAATGEEVVLVLRGGEGGVDLATSVVVENPSPYFSDTFGAAIAMLALPPR